MIADVTDLLRVYDIQLPPDIAMFSKACMTLEGFGRLINPDFDLMEEAEPLIRQWGMDRYKPARLVKKLGVTAMNLVDRIYEEPRHELPTRPASAPSTVWDRQQVERLARRFEHQRFRQTQIVVACSFLIASAILCTATETATLFGLSIIGLIGLIGSTISIQWLLFLYWWSKRSGDL
jgi:ubiquinone biosynthesis protein